VVRLELENAGSVISIPWLPEIMLLKVPDAKTKRTSNRERFVKE